MTIRAREIMTREVVCASPADSAADVARLLSEHRIGAVPVCDADGVPVGMVSEADLLRPFRESQRLRRDWWLGLLAEGERMGEDFLDYMRVDTRRVRELMNRPVVTADEDATLPELAELMVGRGIKRVPILRDGRMVGIVSRADLVAALARTPAMLP